MDRGLFFFLIFGLAIAFGLVNFMDKLQEDDNHLKNDNIQYEKKEIKNYQRYNVLGDSALHLDIIPNNKKFNAWNNSDEKKEIFNAFPDFKRMTDIAKIKLIDGDFKIFLIEELKRREREYISGSLSEKNIRTIFKFEEKLR